MAVACVKMLKKASVMFLVVFVLVSTIILVFIIVFNHTSFTYHPKKAAEKNQTRLFSLNISVSSQNSLQVTERILFFWFLLLDVCTIVLGQTFLAYFINLPLFLLFYLRGAPMPIEGKI